MQRNVLILAAISALISVEFIALAGWLSNRGLAFIWSWPVLVIFMITGHLMAVGRLRDSLPHVQLTNRLLTFLGIEAVWVFLVLFGIFKIEVFKNPAWAHPLIYTVFALSLLTKLTWPWVERGGRALIHKLTELSGVRVIGGLFSLAVLAFIVSVIWIPNIDQAVTIAFLHDRWYHLDGFLMAPAWAHLSGLTLNVDVISQYSVVIPRVMAKVSVWLGGLSYANVLRTFVVCGIVYYIAWFVFLRRWLGSRVLAAGAIILALKVQLFHWGVAPMVWQFGSPTVIRYLWDIVVIACLYRHVQTNRSRYIYAASIIAGCSMAWMIDTGIYLSGAVAMYVGITAFRDVLKGAMSVRAWASTGDAKRIRLKQFIPAILCPVLMAAFYLLTLRLFQGPSIGNPEFWSNMTEHVGLFLNGWGALPIYQGLLEGQVFAFGMGIIIPVFYVVSLLVAAVRVLMREEQEPVFVAFLCLYGLGLYHYFVHRSAVTSYYVGVLPAIALLVYWIKPLWQGLKSHRKVMASLLIMSTLAGALLTGFFAQQYPNIYHPSGNLGPLQQTQFTKWSDFHEDAELVRQFTQPEERVALISSFETAILMEAQRKPFFYYFPLLESMHQGKRDILGTYLHTHARMKRILEQLSIENPRVVFMEKRIFNREVPGIYFLKYESLRQLGLYMREHYEIVGQGKYLLALKPKQPT